MTTNKMKLIVWAVTTATMTACGAEPWFAGLAALEITEGIRRIFS